MREELFGPADEPGRLPVANAACRIVSNQAHLCCLVEASRKDGRIAFPSSYKLRRVSCLQCRMRPYLTENPARSNPTCAAWNIA